MATENGAKWAMVTGSSGGIGKATALALAQAGWNVGIHCATNVTAAQEVASRITEIGRSSLILQADLREMQACAQFVEHAWGETGGFDAWVHLAGADLLTGEWAKLPFEEKLELATHVDLWGTMTTCRQVSWQMLAQGHGSIVTIGWDQSTTGMAGDSGEIFSAIKGAVMAFTRSLAKSSAPLVRVNCVAPGWIETAWGKQASETWQQRVRTETPMRRWGTPEDVADAIVYLVSDQARFVTGQTLLVNGGAVTS